MRRSFGRAVLTGLFLLFVLFLYGPTMTILVLSFQGPDGGLTFPMNGVSVHWFASLFETQKVGDFGGSLARSLMLATMVMAATVAISVAAGMRVPRGFPRFPAPLSPPPVGLLSAPVLRLPLHPPTVLLTRLCC